MATLLGLTTHQIMQHLGVGAEELAKMGCPWPQDLHDPFGYKNMRELVMHLNWFKKKQEEDENLLLLVMSDYDTDGICAADVLTAALSAFGFRFRVHIPSMADGYGLSKASIDRARAANEMHGYKIGMILTADNGITSFSGVSYAKSLGIPVLITDHHPVKDRLPDADVIVDAYQPGDLYPFKGNSGACVAWKAMLAYATLCDRAKLPYIERLVVFAGLSNIADVMPMRDENRYTVVAALEIVKGLLHAPTYGQMADTPWPGYNAVFHGLFDIINMLQQSKDERRAKQKKQPVKLPENEELFGWYLSPLLNAPRRVHDTCLEAMAATAIGDMAVRQAAIKRLIALNEEKSKLRDAVLGELPLDTTHVVVCANTKKGISGLVAGRLSEKSALPAIVFSYEDPSCPHAVYAEPPKGVRLTGSARSKETVPLDRLVDKMNAAWAERHPSSGPLISGGGHATAAGLSIDSDNYGEFKALLGTAILEVFEETAAAAEPVPENEILLTLTRDGLTASCTAAGGEACPISLEGLKEDAEEVAVYLESLRPFGESFQAETEFLLEFDESVSSYGWDMNFWGGRSFKFSIHGLEVLTFDTAWAKEVKETIANGKTVRGRGKLKLNKFRGKTTPQLLLSKAG